MIELLVFIFSVVISISIGTFVFMRDPRHPLNQVYGVLTVAFIVLGVANYMSLSDSANALFYIRLTVCATSICFGALYLLVWTLRKNKNCVLEVFSNWVVIFFAFAMAIVCMTPLVFSGTRDYGGQIGPVSGFGTFLFATYFIVMIVLCYRIIFIEMLRSHGRKKKQFKIILTGLTPTLFLAPLTGVVLPIFFHFPHLIFLTPVYITFFVSMIAYAMIRHQLFDIRFAAVRSAVYVCVLVTLAGIYYVLVYFISRFISFDRDFKLADINPLVVLIALSLGLLFAPIKQFFDRITNKIFYRNEYDADVFYAELNRILTTTTDLKTLLTEVSIKISESLRAEHVSVYVTADGQKVRCAGTAKFVKLPPQDVDTLNEHVQEHGDAIMQIENLDDDERSLRRLMRSNKLAIIAPLVQYDVIVGYLCLGDHKSSHYSERDIKAIDTVADSIVIAIQNALSIQQVKDLNTNLQQRIDDATSELRKSNAQLQRLDEAKDEFISMASHQLRTPLTSVKGYIDMVLEGDAGEIDDMQRHLLTEAFSSSERMVHLINDFLNVSRLQTGKFIIEKVPTDMAKLVRQEVDLLEVNARQRQMTFDLKLGKSIPKLMVDEGKIRQVVMNFLDNSLYYSHADTAIVVRLKAKDGQLELTVKDTGIGVPKKEQAQLFTKFYRASNARRQRPDGTGVGLFLAKKVITAHGGHMLFRSEEGKGSTFGFVLPIDKLRIKD